MQLPDARRYMARIKHDTDTIHQQAEPVNIQSSGQMDDELSVPKCQQSPHSKERRDCMRMSSHWTLLHVEYAGYFRVLMRILP